jgi:hypothetical protein
MPQQVVTGAMAACSFGTAPGSLNILPANRVNANKVPAANIMDNKPMMNVMPLLLCACPRQIPRWRRLRPPRLAC